ncbi:uncharacterized protein V6R79_021422 [Siganus canaliculatus]
MAADSSAALISSSPLHRAAARLLTAQRSPLSEDGLCLLGFVSSCQTPNLKPWMLQEAAQFLTNAFCSKVHEGSDFYQLNKRLNVDAAALQTVCSKKDQDVVPVFIKWRIQRQLQKPHRCFGLFVCLLPLTVKLQNGPDCTTKLAAVVRDDDPETHIVSVDAELDRLVFHAAFNVSIRTFLNPAFSRTGSSSDMNHTQRSSSCSHRLRV